MANAVRNDLLTDEMIDKLKRLHRTFRSLVWTCMDGHEFKKRFDGAMVELLMIRDEIAETVGNVDAVADRLSDLMSGLVFDVHVLDCLFA